MKKETTIRIESLRLIKDPKTFFETDKILAIDVFDTTWMPLSNLDKIKVKAKGQAFERAGKLYIPIVSKGSPENLFLNGKNGFPCKIGNADVLLFFHGKLNEMLAQKKIYDISHCYKKNGLNFHAEFDFFFERYISPYINKTGTTDKKQPARFLFPGNILVQEL